MKQHPTRLIALLALLMAVAAPLQAATMVVKSTAPTGTFIQCKGADPNGYGDYTVNQQTSQLYDISTSDTVRAFPYASGSPAVATAVIETGPTSTGPFGVVATITNPSTTEVGWSIPRSNFLRFTITAYTSGTVRFCLSSWRNGVQIY